MIHLNIFYLNMIKLIDHNKSFIYEIYYKIITDLDIKSHYDLIKWLNSFNLIRS